MGSGGGVGVGSDGKTRDGVRWMGFWSVSALWFIGQVRLSEPELTQEQEGVLGLPSDNLMKPGYRRPCCVGLVTCLQKWRRLQFFLGTEDFFPNFGFISHIDPD